MKFAMYRNVSCKRDHAVRRWLESAAFWFVTCVPPLVTANSASAIVYGVDSRERVLSSDFSDPESIVRAIGNVVATFPNGKVSTGTGTMVSPHHMLTAAHVVYNGAYGGYATNISFYPQRNDRLVNSLLSAKAARTYVPSAYRAANPGEIATDFSSDYSLVSLDRPIGRSTRWIDIQSYEDHLENYWGGFSLPPDTGLVLETAGYPADLPNRSNLEDPRNGTYMYRDYGQVDQVTTSFLRFNPEDERYPDFFSGGVDIGGMDWYPGQSGSPVYQSLYSAISTDQHRILGILSNHQGGTNNAFKISRSVEFDLGVLMAFSPLPGRGIVGGSVTADAPPSFADLVSGNPLYESSLDVFTPSVAQIGDPISLQLGVHNVGTASSGAFEVSFFASTDSEISAEDVFLGEASLNSMSSFSTASASLSVPLPSMPPGRYHVGWIIDPLHSVQEYDEIDNFGVFSGNLFVAPEPGDYNSNGIVDAADYTIWRDTFGQVGVALPADGDGDGVITDGDYTVWKQHFGDMVGTGRTPISVPEPGTWLSITLVAIVGNLKRKYV